MSGPIVRPSRAALTAERLTARNPPTAAPQAADSPTTVSPGPKRAPSRVYQKPAATGPGADQCRQVIQRCGEVIQAARDDVASDLPMVSAAISLAATSVVALARAQIAVLQEFQTATSVADEQNKRLAYQAAVEILRQTPFATPLDRKQAEQRQADRLQADEAQRILLAITEPRQSDDAERIKDATDNIVDLQLEIEKAEYARAFDGDGVDAQFLQRAEALRQKMLSQRYFEQAGWALRILREGLRLGDNERVQIIAYALRPAMIEMVSEGVIARRRAVAASAGRPMAASNDLAAATTFCSLTDKLSAEGSTSIAIAKECARQIQQCFLRTGGRDLVDPASTTAGKFGSMLTSQMPMKLNDPLIVGDDWLTRAVRTTAYRPLPPWSENVPVTVRTGKAVP